MNKYLFILLIQSSVSLFIPNIISPKLKDSSISLIKKSKLLTNMKMNNYDDKNKSKIFKIKFDNNLDNNNIDIYLIIYRIYIYLLIFINWILIAYIIQNT